MSKKSRRIKQQQRGQVQPRILQQQVSHAQHYMLQGDFDGAIATCEPLLSQLPKRSPLRVEVLALSGLAHGMLQHYQESYELFTEAITLDPMNAQLWYNRGLACRYTSRVGQSVRDFERAVKLSRSLGDELTHKFAEELKLGRQILEEEMLAHEEGTTLERFIEREEHFMRAMDLMRRSKWEEGERMFRQIIEAGGRLPQYWGNLGVSLIMQARYDEAEVVLKRALEIDPTYPIARDNLEKMPLIRQTPSPSKGTH